MKIEVLILLITGFFIANAYHEGKYVTLLKSWKKYYQMAFFAFLGLSLYLFVKRHPGHSQSLIKHANGIIKYMPIDKDASDMLSPILDFSTSNMFSERGEKRMMNSGKNMFGGGAGSGAGSGTTKRSVSETKKKFVASRQNWKCGDCNEQLTAWFEVNHIQPLEHGGNNHVDNLEALCRNCHGAKTAANYL